MAYADVLKELARQVRRDTLQVLDATPADALTWTPPGTSNPILWHAGHAVWLLDVLGIALLTGQGELPDGWATVFGQGSQPQRTVNWPSRDEVRLRLQRQWSRLVELLDETSDGPLLAMPAGQGRGSTVLSHMIHGLHDEARHGGEMHLLWKLWQNRGR